MTICFGVPACPKPPYRPTDLLATPCQSYLASSYGMENACLCASESRFCIRGLSPVYRVKFYELLNRASDLSYVVFHDVPPSDTGHHEVHQRFNFPNVRVVNREVSLCGYRAIYQPVIKQIASGSYDAVVLGHEVKFLSNLVLFALCQLSGTPVLWWGHGFSKEEMRPLRIPLLSQTVGALKSPLARSADRYLVYSEGGSERLQQAGMPAEKIAVVRNTMDLESECQLHCRFQHVDPLEIRQKFGLALDSWVRALHRQTVYSEPTP